MATAIDPASHGAEVKLGSDRSFGLVFAGVFGLIGLWPLIHDLAPRWWAIGIAIAFALIALVKAELLRPLNRLWFRFGMLLSRVVSPVVMGLVFFLCVTPIGLIMRMRGKDFLSMRWGREARSYWIIRDPPGPAPETMNRQF